MELVDFIFLKLIWDQNHNLSTLRGNLTGIFVMSGVFIICFIIGLFLKFPVFKFMMYCVSLIMLAIVDILLIQNNFLLLLTNQDPRFNVLITGFSLLFSSIFLIYLIKFGMKLPIPYQDGEDGESIYNDSIYNNEFNRANELDKPKIYERVRLGNGFQEPSRNLICHICGNLNLNNIKICEHCSNDFLMCSICENPISEEKLVFCPFCSSSYHKSEFSEWLKIKARCKCCNKELDLWEFQKYLKEHLEFNEKSSRTCPKCETPIPMDAEFCIYCGINLS